MEMIADFIWTGFIASVYRSAARVNGRKRPTGVSSGRWSTAVYSRRDSTGICSRRSYTGV